jgi:hypothetical protein
MARSPVCAVIGGCCLISRHSTSKQAAAGPSILDIKFLCIYIFRAVIFFKICVNLHCEVRINAATRQLCSVLLQICYPSEVLISSMSEKKLQSATRQQGTIVSCGV